MRPLRLMIIGAFLLSLPVMGKQDSADFEDQARNSLAEKLLKLSRHLDVKVSSFPESAEGGKDYNSNDGNSFLSNTTYHSNVWSRCMEWLGGQFCNRWLDPFISPHGFGSDQSPLEGVVARAWEARKQNGDVAGNTYGVWDVERIGGGTHLDVDGKFDKRGVTDWRLSKDVREEVEKVGVNTAVRAMQSSFDKDSGTGKDIMPNMEGLRLMASRWTKMFRNRLVSNLGEIRAADAPVEFMLNEEMPDCESYLTAAQQDKATIQVEDRIQEQAVLSAPTRAQSLNQRYQRCVALQQASVYMVNPEIENGSLGEGDANTEQIDKWRTRLNIGAVDYAGVDVENLPKPSYANLKPEDLGSALRQYAVGGREYTEVYRTPAMQIEEYNRAIDSAAEGVEEVVQRSYQIYDNSEEIRKYKIEKGSMNMVRINDLTPEMKGELAGTSFPRTNTVVAQEDDPTKNMERKPAQLTVNAIN